MCLVAFATAATRPKEAQSLDASALAAGVLERAGLTLSVDLPAELPRVLADVERMQQVVINLLHNTIKFTPPEGQIAISAGPWGAK